MTNTQLLCIISLVASIVFNALLLTWREGSNYFSYHPQYPILTVVGTILFVAIPAQTGAQYSGALILSGIFWLCFLVWLVDTFRGKRR